MKNTALKTDLPLILTDRKFMSITKGKISGSSIEIKNTTTGEDIGTYTYYDKFEDRNADFFELTK